MKLAIIQIQSINFTIRNNKDKEIITLTFQKFLNSLDFPIQILIDTDSLNLDIYLSQLEQQVELTNKDYLTLFTDFKEHMNSLITTKGLLNRSFYIVVPEQPHITLQVQLSVIQNLLTNRSLIHERLDDIIKNELSLQVSKRQKHIPLIS